MRVLRASASGVWSARGLLFLGEGEYERSASVSYACVLRDSVSSISDETEDHIRDFGFRQSG